MAKKTTTPSSNGATSATGVKKKLVGNKTVTTAKTKAIKPPRKFLSQQTLKLTPLPTRKSMRHQEQAATNQHEPSPRLLAQQERLNAWKRTQAEEETTPMDEDPVVRGHDDEQNDLNEPPDDDDEVSSIDASKSEEEAEDEDEVEHNLQDTTPDDIIDSAEMEEEEEEIVFEQEEDTSVQDDMQEQQEEEEESDENNAESSEEEDDIEVVKVTRSANRIPEDSEDDESKQESEEESGEEESEAGSENQEKEDSNEEEDDEDSNDDSSNAASKNPKQKKKAKKTAADQTEMEEVVYEEDSQDEATPTQQTSPRQPTPPKNPQKPSSLKPSSKRTSKKTFLKAATKKNGIDFQEDRDKMKREHIIFCDLQVTFQKFPASEALKSIREQLIYILTVMSQVTDTMAIYQYNKDKGRDIKPEDMITVFDRLPSNSISQLAKLFNGLRLRTDFDKNSGTILMYLNIKLGFDSDNPEQTRKDMDGVTNGAREPKNLQSCGARLYTKSLQVPHAKSGGFVAGSLAMADPHWWQTAVFQPGLDMMVGQQLKREPTENERLIVGVTMKKVRDGKKTNERAKPEQKMLHLEFEEGKEKKGKAMMRLLLKHPAIKQFTLLPLVHVQCLEWDTSAPTKNKILEYVAHHKQIYNSLTYTNNEDIADTESTCASLGDRNLRQLMFDMKSKNGQTPLFVAIERSSWGTSKLYIYSPKKVINEAQDVLEMLLPYLRHAHGKVVDRWFSPDAVDAADDTVWSEEENRPISKTETDMENDLSDWKAGAKAWIMDMTAIEDNEDDGGLNRPQKDDENASLWNGDNSVKTIAKSGRKDRAKDTIAGGPSGSSAYS